MFFIDTMTKSEDAFTCSKKYQDITSQIIVIYLLKCYLYYKRQKELSSRKRFCL